MRLAGASTIKEKTMRTFKRWLLPLLVALFTTAGAAPGQTATGATAIPRYKLIQLSKDPIFFGADINAKGQVAFTEYNNGNPRARFFDGYTIRDLGTLGGPTASVAALNDLGQVTGSASVSPDGRINHAYRWTQSTGMIDLTSTIRNNSQSADINNKGQIAGTLLGGGQGLLPYGFFWSRQAGLLNIGQLDAYSWATAMNDNGTIVGYGGADSPNGVRAFRWTRAEGIQDIGTLPDEFTLASDVNNREHIVGATPFSNVPFPSYVHAFIWTRNEGLRDLGTGTGNRSTAAKINENDMVIGHVLNFPILYHGFVWTRENGLLEIGANRPDLQTFVGDLNNHNQVVGGYGPWAFIWTRATGVVDLNTRLVGAPPGLVLSGGQAISDKGLIVASANQGLFLLVPVPAP
jgi:probable HAF family extracellular repeat protein